MAKYRHRIFEMYEFRDEATRALTMDLDFPHPEAATPEPWNFKHLSVSTSASVSHVTFKSHQICGGEVVDELREDFSLLAVQLTRDSKVLMDFVGVTSFCAASIDELVLFNQKLRTKGSRIVLCGLEPTVQASFF